MEDDATILRQFTQDGSESAFGELVRRHVDAVYSTALRLSNGQTALAEDITQGVFTDFARKAHTFPPGTLLGGWLYRATRNTAAATLRSERRRAAREKEAIMLQETNRLEESASWEIIRPLLDDSLDGLKEADRDALLLRYFQQRSLREIGSALGVSEDAARMRIDRALERLKSLLAAKGVPSTAAALGMILETQVVGSAPVAFVQTLSATAIGAAALAPVSTLSLVTLMSTTTTKIAIPILVAACLSIPLIQQHRTVNRLLGENARLQAASQVPTHGNTESHPVVDDANDLQLELARLRGEVAGKRELEKELSKLKEDAKRRAPVIRSKAAPLESEEAAKQRIQDINIGRMQFSRQWALILMMFSEEHGRLPGPDDDLSHYDLPDQEIHGVKMTSTDLELTSATPIKEIANPAAAFIGRERNLWLTPDEGKLGRTYVFADGHTEIRTYASTDDIDRWEKQHLPQLRESQ